MSSRRIAQDLLVLEFQSTSSNIGLSLKRGIDKNSISIFNILKIKTLKTRQGPNAENNVVNPYNSR